MDNSESRYASRLQEDDEPSRLTGDSGSRPTLKPRVYGSVFYDECTKNKINSAGTWVAIPSNIGRTNVQSVN